MKIVNLIFAVLILITNVVVAEAHDTVAHRTYVYSPSLKAGIPHITQSFTVLPEDNDAVDYDGRELTDIKINNAVSLLKSSSCAKRITEEVANLLADREKITKVFQSEKCRNSVALQSVEFRLEFETSSKGTCDGRTPRIKIKMVSNFKNELIIEHGGFEFERIDWKKLESGIMTSCQSVESKFYSEAKLKATKENELFKKNPLSMMPVLLNFFK